MADSESTVRATRAKLARVIRRRPRVGPVAAVIMSLVFALVGSAIVMLDPILIKAGSLTFEEGKQAPITVRAPQFTGFSEGGVRVGGGPVVVARGEVISPVEAQAAQVITRRSPNGLSAFAGYFAGLFLVALLYTTHLRRSNRGRLVRTQSVTLLLLLGGALVFKLLLLLTPVSIMVVPIAGAALVAALVVDLTAGLTTALVGSILIGLLVPFDLGVLAVLAVQSTVPVMIVGERHHKNRHVALAGLVGGVAAAMAYLVLYHLSGHGSAVAELSEPQRSALVAAAVGGPLSAAIAIPAKPLYQFLLGDITRNKLVELEDLSNPMLRQIAENAPGTWQHTLAMANMAEMAANAIGANARLVRVGAYYHDLGKSLQPKYFIENLEPGESSPHDRLSPEVSCDAIFAHVTEGIRLARKSGLPERIIDFMHMHHGDGLLEYFWGKCQEQGNPKNLTPDDFRYPGVPPQSRETAILAIVDAVEAASRTLKSPDSKAISNLVQRIVYGKLHLGQLDESGLSMADLRKISDSLRETIKHASHGRIEYPWQREERAAREQAQDMAQPPKPADTPTPFPMAGSMSTQRMIAEPRLDSLDVPRPYWQRAVTNTHPPPSQGARAGSGTSRRDIELAVTEQVTPHAAAHNLVTGGPVTSEAGTQTPAPLVSQSMAAMPVMPAAPISAQSLTTMPAQPTHAQSMAAMPVMPVQPAPAQSMTTMPAVPTAQPAGAPVDDDPAALMPAELSVLPPPRKGPATARNAAVEAAASEPEPAEPAAAMQPQPAPPLAAFLPPAPADEARPARPSSVNEVDASAIDEVIELEPHSMDRAAAPEDDAGDSYSGTDSYSSTDSDFDDEKTVIPEYLTPSVTTRRMPPPPPGSPERLSRGTIELMKETQPASRPARPDSNGPLAPGTMIMGPPPATRPTARPTPNGTSKPAPGEPDNERSVVAPVTIMPRKRTDAKPSE